MLLASRRAGTKAFCVRAGAHNFPNSRPAENLFRDHC